VYKKKKISFPKLLLVEWCAIPLSCSEIRLNRHLIHFISDLHLDGGLHHKKYCSVLKAVNEVDSKMCSGSWQQPERFNFF